MWVGDDFPFVEDDGRLMEKRRLPRDEEYLLRGPLIRRCCQIFHKRCMAKTIFLSVVNMTQILT
jgi:hypothetical protein